MKAVQRIAKGSFYLLIICSVLGLSAWRVQAWWSWASAPAIESASQQGKRVIIQIPQGTSAQQIGQELETAGLIKSAKAWELWARWLMWKQPDGGFQAGNYELSTAEPLQAIAQKIWTGEVAQRSFTIPEGWSLRQMASYFEQQGFFKAQDFLTAASQLPTGKYPWLPTGVASLEGFLYPDTYQISAGAQVTPTEVITQMLDRFEQVALPLYNQERDRTQFSLAQWVTLASIVEKEAVVAAERPRIAGVFTNRLKQNIPLGSDPTVEYALGVQQTKEQPLTLEQVKVESPYNTYINAGLPPAPIASPGLASLKATLAPEVTDYLYFVAKYDGTHVFSRTLGEHESAQGTIRDTIDKRATKPQEKPKKPGN
ncbi:endolytic transglycosylase MltG [Phormidesmis priestleyi ULC007]|uniref:Endolytic murein transglycosylase n=1 Tax=Phormidesmis priestleyi ULC007 TaxID=1920490 RepID=A0A2T1DAJ9_9CYAN|nr:endolytic transglycosylase MltG [Phormidesmis priestleyi]PSB17506.1 endolytic transglycosylase MltG [Phormidesmis priestleyi ULC007]